MGNGADKSQRASAWVTAIGVLLVLAVLYFLSSGPVAALAVKSRRPPVLSAVGVLYAPLMWLAQNTPLGGPIIAYVFWWYDVLDVWPYVWP